MKNLSTQSRWVALLTMLSIGCMEQPQGGEVSSELISTDMTTYVNGQTVTVNFTDQCGATSDWISIAVPGSSNVEYVQWAYTGGGAAGSLAFAAVPAGTYVARGYCDWAGTQSFTVVQESAPFTVQVGGATTIVSDAASYVAGVDVQATYANAPGFSDDWVAISEAGSAATSYTTWMYTGGGPAGTRALSTSSLPDGTYVVRIYGNNTFTIAAESASFTVAGAALATVNAPAAVGIGATFSVTFTNFQGQNSDWIAIANVGAAPNDYIASVYTGGGSSGSVIFSGLAAGNYEARGYFSWPSGGFTVRASDAFVVASNTPSIGAFAGFERTVAYAVSGDGQYATGLGRTDAPNPPQGARWPVVGAPDVWANTDGGTDYAAGYGANSDGSVMVGYSVSSTAIGWATWTPALGMAFITGSSGYAYGTNAAGNIIVGVNNNVPALYDGMAFTSLGDLAGGEAGGEAYAVSADGTIVVGWGNSTSGQEAFSWTSAGGMVGLGDLTGGTFASIAYAISGDGLTIVGGGQSASGREAFRWTTGGGMVGLGDLAGGSFDSFASDCSADGAVIVGGAMDATGSRAFVWTSSAGMQSIEAVLSAAGVDVTGWNLETAWGVSDDGRVVVGQGYNPSGGRVGFRAVLP